MRTLSFVLLLAVSLLVTVVTASMIFASMWAQQATIFLADWQKRGIEPSEAAWQVALSAANKAITYSPVKNAHYYDTLGHIWDWRHFTQAYGDTSVAQSRLHAIRAYRQAIKLRPTWPYSWINLAYAKLKSDELDDEFNQALDSAFQSGPWRIKVNRHVADIGFAAWGRLAGDTRRIVLTAINRTVAYSRDEAHWLEASASLSGRHALFCFFIADHIQKQQGICR